MASCNGCGDPSDRMTGTLPAPSDADSFTILVGRTTFRVPRSARFTDLGGGNYAGYLMHYQTFENVSLREYVATQLTTYNNKENSQHAEAEFDDARHRATLTYDSSDSMRHLEMYQDLGDGGALVFEADYQGGGKPYAVAALTALANDVVPVKPGDPIPKGMGLGDSVLARSTLNDEIANASFVIPLPGYSHTGTFSGVRIEIVSEMSAGPAGDSLDAKCHSGQLSQYDAISEGNDGHSLLSSKKLLRYRERDVAGIAGGETADLETATDGSFRQASFTFITDAVFPPAGQPTLTIRADTNGLQRATISSRRWPCGTTFLRVRPWRRCQHRVAASFRRTIPGTSHCPHAAYMPTWCSIASQPSSGLLDSLLEG